MGAIVADWVPLAWGAFRDYRQGAVTLSAQAVAVLQRRLRGEAVTQEASGMSAREWREFTALWG
jgi:thymidylate synthase (FAD)